MLVYCPQTLSEDKEDLCAYALAEEVLDDEAPSRLGETCAAERSEAMV